MDAYKQWFDISFNKFGRTTTPWQTKIAQDIFHKCDDNGWVNEADVEQLYCEDCKRFLADRYVEGKLPASAYIRNSLADVASLRLHIRCLSCITVSVQEYDRVQACTHTHTHSVHIYTYVCIDEYMNTDIRIRTYSHTYVRTHSQHTGTCPECSYDDARGDQCDKCGNMLNAIDLINPRCKVCERSPKSRISRHLFLDLPTLTPQLKSFVDAVR